MKVQHRSYQIEAVNSIYNYFNSASGNPVIAMPTGTGKSVVIAFFLQSVFHYFQNQKVLVLTHVKELIEQNYDKLLGVWPNAPAGINSAGIGQRDTLQKIIFGGIASVYKQWQQFGKVDLLLIDEAHLVSPNDETMYRTFIECLKSVNPHLKIIGFTATPWRLGQGRITDDGIFTDVCFDITTMEAFNRLIQEGYLSMLVPRPTRTVLDTSGVHMRGGEFIASELQFAVDKQEVTFAALKETLEQATDRKHWLIFCSGVEHSIHTADILNMMGIPAAAVHSKISTADRDRILEEFKSGKIRAVTNNNVLTTGFDFPEIDLIVMLRPTASPVLWVQMLGRGTRPVYAPGFDLNTEEGRLLAILNGPKKNCLVLDFAGNTKRLGPINDPVIPKKKGEKAGEAPIKICEQCGTYNHASARQCFFCGAEFPIQTKIAQSASTEELIKQGDAPVVEVFRIDHITYAVHTKHDRPPIMQVSYHCGLKLFKDYVCVEHEGFAAHKARRWWRQRADFEMPLKTELCLENSHLLKTPTHLRVWTNKKFPEIMNYCFDGTAFGTVVPSEADEGPIVRPYKARPEAILTPSKQIGPEDDIPF